MTPRPLPAPSPSSLQARVVDAARQRLARYRWFCGVCLDQLWEDAEIERSGFVAAVDALVIDTTMWDAQ